MTPKAALMPQGGEDWSEWPGDEVAPARAENCLGVLAGLVEVRKGLDVEISGFARAARALGASWGDLGKVLGVTPQAVQQRYGAAFEGATGAGKGGAVKGRPQAARRGSP